MTGSLISPGPSRPVLRWHGGKWRLAPWIVGLFPDHRIYVEPFGGAASVLLRKPRSYAEVYNDLDAEVVNLFQVLRSDEAPELIRALRLTPFAEVEFLASYIQGHDAVERARRLVVRSFMGFGSNAIHRRSGFRQNSNRSGTTPARDWMNYPDALAAIIERLRGVVIMNRQAIDVMAAHDGPQTLHYVDPPYVWETRDGGTDYAHELDDHQHRELLQFLCDLKGRVVLSGYLNPLYDTILGNWHRVDRDAFADGARPRTESVWLNYAPADDAQAVLL